MSPFKSAFLLVAIAWHYLRAGYLQAAIERQIAGRGWADKDAEESLKANQIALQLARLDLNSIGGQQ